jgi:hypothetical protein
MHADTIIPLPFASPAVLEVTAPACALAVVATQPGEAPFLESSEALADIFKPAITLDGGTVRVKFDFHIPQPFPFSFWDFGPKVQLTLHVPPDVKARLRLDAGRARIRGLSGCDLDIEASAGVLTLRDVTGRMRLVTGAGKITGEHLSGTIDAEANAGTIRLQVDRLATGKHRIHSTMGSVRLDLAAGQKVQINARAAMGSVRNSYPSSPGAEASVDVQTDFGSVRIVEGAGEPSSPAPEEGMFGGGWWGAWPGFVSRRWGHQGPWHQGGGGHSARPPRPEASEQQPPREAASKVSDEELRRILTLVQEGKLSPEEAQKLLRAMGQV